MHKPDKPQIILLEHPRPANPERAEDVVNSPLSASLMTGYIASVLKSNDINVEIIDANMSGWSIEETVKELKNRSFLLIGVRIVYLWEKTDEVFRLLSELSNHGVKSHINLYGHYPTFAFKNILRCFPFIDSITIGEPEYTFLELAKSVIGNEQKDNLSSINGLAYRNMPGEPRPRRLISNLNSLPFPDRGNIESKKRKGVATYILGSRGCYNHCGFCYLNQFYGYNSGWRGRSAINIFEEIKQLFDQNGCANFYFADANFFGQGKAGRERAEDMSNLIIEHGLKINFGIECRANDIDEDTILLLVRAGLKDLFIGIESGDQSTLNSFRKKTTVDVNRNAINIARKCGIEPNVGFIMFGKDIDFDGIRNNFEFLEEMRLLTDPYTTAHLLYHKQTIFQGTPDYKSKIMDANSKNKNFDMFQHADEYELSFDYRDKRMSAFVDIAGNFCRTALKNISDNGTSKNITDKNCKNTNNNSLKNSYPARLNETLINLFAQTLSSFERDDPDLDDRRISILKEEHKKAIKSLYTT